jgi:hypothetical protein
VAQWPPRPIAPSRIHGWLAAEAAGDASALAEAAGDGSAAVEAPDVGPDAGLGLPVGASGPGGDVAVPLAATAAAEGSDGSDAGALGTAGSAALAGTTTAVAGGEFDVCLLQPMRSASVPTVVHIASLLIQPAPGAGRTTSGGLRTRRLRGTQVARKRCRTLTSVGIRANVR